MIREALASPKPEQQQETTHAEYERAGFRGLHSAAVLLRDHVGQIEPQISSRIDSIDSDAGDVVCSTGKTDEGGVVARGRIVEEAFHGGAISAKTSRRQEIAADQRCAVVSIDLRQEIGIGVD